MATKVFQGEVIESTDGSFPEKKTNPETGKFEETGMMITGWNITLLLNESSQKRFFISAQNVCYTEAKQVVKGATVRVHADAVPGFKNEPKWVPVQIERL